MDCRPNIFHNYINNVHTFTGDITEVFQSQKLVGYLVERDNPSTVHVHLLEAWISHSTAYVCTILDYVAWNLSHACDTISVRSCWLLMLLLRKRSFQQCMPVSRTVGLYLGVGLLDSCRNLQTHPRKIKRNMIFWFRVSPYYYTPSITCICCSTYTTNHSTTSTTKLSSQ